MYNDLVGIAADLADISQDDRNGFVAFLLGIAFVYPSVYRQMNTTKRGICPWPIEGIGSHLLDYAFTILYFKIGRFPIPG